MATLVLVRHARSTANSDGVLTGRLRGVRLDETGRAQAARLGERLASVPLAALVTSPLERCKETAAAIRRHQRDELATTTERGLVECDYGEWQGRPLEELSREKLWKAIQRQPGSVTFPRGESLAGMSARAVAAVRRHDAEVERTAGPRAVWAAVTHGDIVKALLADALGMHLDLFQRLHADPGSVSVIRYAPESTYVLQSNTHEGDLSWLAPKGRRAPRGGVVGGGSGPATGPVH